MMDKTIMNDYTDDAIGSKVKVFVRVRPMDDLTSPLPQNMFPSKDDQTVIIRKPDDLGVEHKFSFDQIFWEDANQEKIHSSISSYLIGNVMQGFNTSCFAYGQTGSGKTYTIFGEGGEKRGMIPRGIDELFKTIKNLPAKTNATVNVSFLEMYCDKIRDLGIAFLQEKEGVKNFQNTSDWYFQSSNDELEIREDADGQVIVKGLSSIPVTTSSEIISILNTGFKLRATQETLINATSSRSHTVFTLTLTIFNEITKKTTISKLNYIDLAGSERVKKSDASGQRLKEALDINKSLSSLGKVVLALNSGESHIPYRDSKLTRLLQNSLGGNSYTVLLATVRPNTEHYEEGLNTLQFATRCRSVFNQPRVNTILKTEEELLQAIRELREENIGLRAMLATLKQRADLRLKAIMEQLGIDGEIMQDGKFRTKDGRILGITISDEYINEEVSQVGSIMERGKIQKQFDNTPEIQEAIKAYYAEKNENSYLRNKLDRMNETIRNVEIECKAEVESIRRKNADLYQQVLDLQNEIESLKKQHRMELQQLRLEHEDNINNVHENNRTILAQRENAISEISNKLKVDSDYISTMKTTVDTIKLNGATELSQEMKSFTEYYENKIDNLKKQYSYWYNLKDQQIAKFRDDFNKYYTHHQKKVEAYQTEILMLYEYCNKLAYIIEKIEKGTMPLTKSLHIKGFILRDTSKPEALLNDPNRIAYLKQQLAISKDLTDQRPQSTPVAISHQMSAIPSPPQISTSKTFSDVFKDYPPTSSAALDNLYNKTKSDSYKDMYLELNKRYSELTVAYNAVMRKLSKLDQRPATTNGTIRTKTFIK